MKSKRKGEVIALTMGVFLGLLISSFWVVGWVSDSKSAETTVGLSIKYGLPLLLDALLTYGVFATYLASREKKKWSGVKRKALEDVASLYNWLYTAVGASITRDPQAAQSVLHNAKYRHGKVQSLITMSGTGLGSDTLPQLLNIVESIDLLIPKIEFLIMASGESSKLSQQRKQGLFLIEAVPDDLAELKADVLNCLSNDETVLKNSNLHAPSDLTQDWSGFVQRVGLRTDIDSDIDATGKSSIIIFNIETATRCRINAPVGTVMQTFYY